MTRNFNQQSGFCAMIQLRKHLALVGYRASGKTTLGLLAAERLGCQWLDLDAFIEESCARSIATIFADSGEEAFRAIESDCLNQVCQRAEPLVLSTGGGCVLRASNRKILRDSCQSVIYLQAPAAVLSQRLEADAGGRPSLTGADIAVEVEEVLGRREALYEEAATHILDATMSQEQLVHHLLKIVEN